MSSHKSYPVLVPRGLIDRATAVWHAHGGHKTMGGRFVSPNDVIRHAAHFGALFVTADDVPTIQPSSLPVAWRVGFWLETEASIRRLGLPIAAAFRVAIDKGLRLYEMCERDSG